MKKRGLLLTFFLGVMLIGFASAQYGYYGTFSLSNFLDSIGPSTMILSILFIIFFAILHNIVFITFFRGNTGISAIVSLLVSVLAIYGINRARWDIGGLFYGLGISSGILSIVIPFILLIAAIYIIVKFGLSWLFLIFGIFLTSLALFTDLIYERGIALLIGGIFLLIGIWLWKRNKKRAYYDDGYYPGSVGRGERERGEVFPKYRSYRRDRKALKYEHKLGEYGRGLEVGARAKRINRIRNRRERIEKRRRNVPPAPSGTSFRRGKELKGTELVPSRDLKSLIRQYNRLQREDSGNPRLRDIAETIKSIRRGR